MRAKEQYKSSGYLDGRICRRAFIKALSLAILGTIIAPHRIFPRVRKGPTKILTNPTQKPRVVRVYSPRATNWDYSTEPYFDFIDQNVVNEMVDRGICELTGENTPSRGWKEIMSSYKNGDKIAMKPNFNMINRGYRDLVTSPQVINGVIKGLVEYVGVPEKDVFVYDLCKVIPDSIMRNRIRYSVNYVQRRATGSLLDKVKVRLGYGLESADTSAPIHMREKIVDEAGEAITCYVPKVLIHCQHLINLPILTNHIYVLASGPLKNHFGTVRFSNYNAYPVCLHGQVLEKSIVDINLNAHIRDKTRLILCDALFGVYHRGELSGKRRWRTFPPQNGTPNSIFLATDPVAIESVMCDYIQAEREFHGYKMFSGNYLHDAMEKIYI